MNDFTRYWQRVILQRDGLYRLYQERELTRRLLDTINRLPVNAATNSARFRYLCLQARLNNDIAIAERTERVLSLRASVIRYDNNGNNTNLGNNNNRNNRNSQNGNNTNSQNGNSTSQANNRFYNIDRITPVFFYLWASVLITSFVVLGLFQFAFI